MPHFLAIRDDVLAGTDVTVPAVSEAIYLGTSYASFRHLQDHLSASSMTLRGIGERLAAVLPELSSEIINLDHRLWPRGRWRDRWRDYWDASDLAERAPHSGALPRMAACAVVFLRASADPTPKLFIVESHTEARLFASLAAANGLAIKPLGHAGATGAAIGFAAWCVLSGLRRRAGVVTRLWAKKRAMKRLRGGRPGLDLLRGARVVLVNWAGKGTYSAHQRLTHDRFLGELPAILAERGIPYAYLSNSLDFSEPFPPIAKEVAAAADKVVLMCEVQSVTAVALRAVASLAFPALVRRQLTMAGWDLSPLVRHFLWLELASWRQTEALAYAATGPSLVRHGISPRSIVHVYEFHPWEKLLAAGVRRVLDTECIGAMVSFFADTYLSSIPSRDDIAMMRIPNRIVTTGDGARDRLVRHGFPSDRIQVGGAIRYSLQPILQAAQQKERRTILCCGDIEFNETLQLVTKAIAATAATNGLNLMVNLHPSVDEEFRAGVIEQSQRLAGCPVDHVAFSEAGAKDLLADADLVLYGQTGSVFEALAAGKPVVFVGGEIDLVHDKIPEHIPIPRVTEVAGLATFLRDWLANQNPLTLDDASRLSFLASTVEAIRPDVWAELGGDRGLPPSGDAANGLS